MKTSLLKTHKTRIIQKELVHGFRNKIWNFVNVLKPFSTFC